MTIQRNSRITLVFQIVCLFGLSISTLVSASDVCKSKECQELVATIKANMDSSVDPCKDYFQYACGNFIKNNPTPEGRDTFSTMSIFTIQSKELLYNLLKEPENPDDSKSIKAVKRQFKICTNEGAVEAAGLTALLNVIHKNGGWPMIVPDVFPYQKRVLEVQDEYNRITGNGPLYTVLVYSRQPGSSDNAITLDQPAPFPNKNYNASDPVNAKQFVRYIAGVAAEFAKADGVFIPLDRLQEDAEKVLEFHIKLSQLREPDEFRLRGESMKVSEAQKAIQNRTSTPFDLLTALQRLYSHVPDVTLTKDEVINVRELRYMQGLVKLLSKTSPVTVLNYIHFHFVERYLPLTTKAVRNLVNEVYHSKPANRTIQCASLLNMRTALSRMFIKRYAPESKKLAAEGVLNAVKAQVKLQIERTAFIDDETRPKALAKVDNLATIVAHTALFDTDENIDQVYEKYHMTDDVVANMLNYHEVKYRKELEELREIINRTELRVHYQMSPILDGITYSLVFNRLGLPSSVLQTPLFSDKYPALSNFAGLGQAIGLRLAELYSFLGTQFDDQGKMINWASHHSYNEFEKRDQCFIDQYSTSTIKELADVGLFFNTSALLYKPVLARYHFALKTAYLAQKNSGTHNERLPMSEPVDKQFFLNFANMYCQSANPSRLLKSLKEEVPHNPPGRMKVNSALANFPEFSKVYGCPIGSPMNPVKKCSTLD